MLPSLDILIALVTYLSICSLFVLIIVQMISFALSLRGRNLARALEVTFNSIAPQMTGSARQLARRILSDPVFSDSIMAPKKMGDGDQRKIADQVGILRKGIAILWKLLTPIQWLLRPFKLANAIRPEEVYAALVKLASGNETDVKATAESVLTNIKNIAPIGEGIKSRIEALIQIANLVPHEDAKAAMLKSVSEVSAGLVKHIDTAEERFQGWCNAAQDRAEQWFRTHTRACTIGVSILFAFACRIDGIELFQLVSTNPIAREALLKAGTELVAQDAHGILGERGRVETWVRDEWNRTLPQAHHIKPVSPLNTLAEVKAAALAVAPTTDAVTPLVETAASEMKAAEDKVTAAKAEADKNPGSKEKAEALADAVKAHQLADDKHTSLTDLGKSFEEGFSTIESFARKHYLEAQKEVVHRLESIGNLAGYPIIPKAWKWKLEPKDDWRDGFEGLTQSWSHFLGVLLFASLLTLGAPYWFNLLKNLASLRPALSQLIEGEKQTEKPASGP